MTKQKVTAAFMAGLILGLAMWLISGMLWLLPVGIVCGLITLPVLRESNDPARPRKRRDQNFRD